VSESERLSARLCGTTQALTEHIRNSRLGKELLGHVVFLVIFSVVTIVPVRSNVDEFVPYTQHVNLGIVRQGKEVRCHVVF